MVIKIHYLIFSTMTAELSLSGMNHMASQSLKYLLSGLSECFKSCDKWRCIYNTLQKTNLPPHTHIILYSLISLISPTYFPLLSLLCHRTTLQIRKYIFYNYLDSFSFLKHALFLKVIYCLKVLTTFQSHSYKLYLLGWKKKPYMLNLHYMYIWKLDHA